MLPLFHFFLQDPSAPAGSAAAQELPAAAAEALLQQYSRDAPDKLPLVKQALARYL
jgi:hypothetical protein